MKEETKNLYVAIILSVMIIFGVNHFFTPTASNPAQTQVEVLPEIKQVEQKVDTALNAAISVEDVLSKDARALIKTPSLEGSVRLKGARFDYLELPKYKQTIDADSPDVQLLSPSGTQNPYFAEFGFLASNPELVPDPESLWINKTSTLTPDNPLVLEWNNSRGLKFTRRISIDEHYLMTIADTVENHTSADVTIFPYGRIYRSYDMKNFKRSVVHEGVTGVINSSAKEIKLSEIKEKTPKTYQAETAWLGFSDRYWFTAFILDDGIENTLTLSKNGEDNYQADFRSAPMTIAANSQKTHTVRFFAGAKEIKLLDQYTKQGLKKFDLAVDFGWYYFLTKPFFYILDFLYKLIGNMGWAILLFAALLRLFMFPIANKSYDSMSKMKKIQPKVLALQAMYKDNKMLLQQKTMELYKKEKINPASGCLPMFIQIPIFFSLYKVLNIAIEIRHAPFIGWVKDLSAPDPLTISVWSHIPLPAILDIGVWPILMGLTMWVQQKLNPAPANKDQALMFAMLPLVFTLMLAHFAVGLVIYWTLSNLLSLIQQKAIMRKNGVK